MRGALADGERIRRERLAQGLTQEQLAASADVDVKTVRKAEQGRRLDVETLTSLARVLGVAPPTLMTEIPSEGDIQRIRLQAVERWIRCWDQRDIAGLMELYYDEAVLLLPGSTGLPFGGRFEGLEAIRRANELAWQAVPTDPVKPGDYSLVADDDTVVMHGTKSIRLPDGRQMPLSSVHVYRFTDGLIAELRVEYDTLALHRLLSEIGNSSSPL